MGHYDRVVDGNFIWWRRWALRKFKNEKLVERAVKKFIDSHRIEENEIKRIKGDFYNEIKAISGKVNRLIDMRMEGELSKEEYLEMRGKVEEEKKQAEQRLADFEKQVGDRTNL